MGSVVSTLVCKAKSAKKNLFFCLAILEYFQSIFFKSEITSFHYFSPQDSESPKILDIPLCEVGAKRRLNGFSKVNTRTNRRTDRQTDRRTFQLIGSTDPEGRCFEKCSQSYFREINQSDKRQRVEQLRLLVGSVVQSTCCKRAW